MISTSPARSEASRIDVILATSKGGASRYDPRLTGWRRVTSIFAPGLILAGLAGLTFLFGGTDLVRRAKEQSLEVFAVGLPPPPPPEPAPPAPPIETPVEIRSQPVVPQTPTALAPPVVTVPPPTPAPIAVAPAQPQVATSSAATTPVADAGPVYVSNPTCSIATPAYPTRAKRLQQTGTVRIAVTIDASGRIVGETVRKSSGHDALDAAALATVRAGRCRPSADGRSISSVLPIAFTLDQ